MKTKRLVVIGYPIEHSLSPAMQNAAIKKLRLESRWSYDKMSVKPESLAGFVHELRSGEIHGANVTIPHKVAIIKHLDGLTEEAEMISAVNTVFRKDNKLLGHNTDGIGCIRALEEAGVKVHDKKILILGSGGAARAVSFLLAMNGVKDITILDLNVDMIDALEKDLEKKTSADVKVGPFEMIPEVIKHMDIVINCTPIGMKGDNEKKTLIPKILLKPNLIIMDIVYNPRETLLLKQARELGCKTVEGIGMLLHQGAEAFELWTGEKAPIEAMRKALMEALK